MKLQPGTPGMLHLPHHPSWVVCDRQWPQGCCLDGLPSDSYPSELSLIFTILEIPQTTLQGTEPPRCLFILVCAFWWACDHPLQHCSHAVIPPCFCDGYCVTAFLLSYAFQLLLNVARATLVYMHFSWADFTPDSGSSLESLVSSPSPFTPSLKASQSALSTPHLVWFSPV